MSGARWAFQGHRLWNLWEPKATNNGIVYPCCHWDVECNEQVRGCVKTNGTARQYACRKAQLVVWLVWRCSQASLAVMCMISWGAMKQEQNKQNSLYSYIFSNLLTWMTSVTWTVYRLLPCLCLLSVSMCVRVPCIDGAQVVQVNSFWIECELKHRHHLVQQFYLQGRHWPYSRK